MNETATNMLSEAFNESFDDGFPQLITPKNTDIPASRMVFLPGDTFTMGGSEYKPHKVKLSSFYMAAFQVTQELYLAITGNNPSRFQNPKKPVEQVTWFSAVDFCNELSTKIGLQQVYKKTGDNEYEWVRTAKGIRLPTEAEWEYAARGGAQEYAGSNKLENVGWYNENSHGQSKKPGLKFPNATKLYDMSGNLFEWCYDWYGKDYYQKCKDEGIVKNPDGPKTGEYRVLRGGSWRNYAIGSRTAYRRNILPGGGWLSYGFRMVLGL